MTGSAHREGVNIAAPSQVRLYLGSTFRTPAEETQVTAHARAGNAVHAAIEAQLTAGAAK